MSGEPCRKTPNGSAGNRTILTTSDLILILFMVRDGRLTKLDVAILTEKYSRPATGYKALGKALRVPAATIQYRIRRFHTLFRWNL